MSAFVWLDNFAARGRIARGAWASLAALVALVASGVAFAQAANAVPAAS